MVMFSEECMDIQLCKGSWVRSHLPPGLPVLAHRAISEVQGLPVCASRTIYPVEQRSHSRNQGKSCQPTDVYRGVKCRGNEYMRQGRSIGSQCVTTSQRFSDNKIRRQLRNPFAHLLQRNFRIKVVGTADHIDRTVFSDPLREPFPEQARDTAVRASAHSMYVQDDHKTNLKKKHYICRITRKNETSHIMKRTIIAAAALLMAAGSLAQAQPSKAPEYQFTTVKENKITPVKNQYRSGTCWCFSTLSFIESEILRQTGIETDLSEMFVVSRAYHDRAVKYVRLDGNLGFSAGSSFGDVFQVIKKYGIATQEQYSGLQYGTSLPEQNEMDAVLAAYVRAVVANPNKKLSTAWLKGLDGVLQAYQGEWPDLAVTQAKRDELKINVDDYVNICSFASEELYQPHIIEVADNWRWGAAYNVTMDEMMDILYKAIEGGYTVAWGADVSESGFTRNGLAIVPKPKEAKPAAGSDQEHWLGKEEAKPESAAAELPEEMTITDEMRQLAYDCKETTDDHGMHIYGVAKDQNGNKYFMVKNSWGDSGKYHGIWYASDAYVRYKTLNFIVHKDALSKDMKKKLNIK